MDYSCPYCGENLKGRLLTNRPLPSQRRFLPENAHIACPRCKGFLLPHGHPFEVRGFLLVLVGGVLPIFLVAWLRLSIYAIAAAILSMVVCATVGVVMYFKIPKSWPRYARIQSPNPALQPTDLPSANLPSQAPPARRG